jgi:hypothetical protein
MQQMNIAKGFAFLLLSSKAMACATCGVGQSFNVSVLLLGSAFILLPMGIVAAVAYRVWKDSKRS